MKILRIENGSGQYRANGDSEWKSIDKIVKDDLITLLDTFLNSDIEMDNFDNEKLSNQAHQIIYKSIFEKLSSLEENKDKFKDEADRTYLASIDKYSE